MNPFWVKAGFLIFVLAPVWSALLWFVVSATVKNTAVKNILSTLFATILMVTLLSDFVFMAIGFIAELKGFVATWNYLWHGEGVWLWIWIAVGYIIATIISVISGESEEYPQLVFKCTLVVMFIYFLIQFLMFVANALVMLG